MATAELAVAIPTHVLVLFGALSALATVTDLVRCVDAARATARALARGDDQGAALAMGRRLAPPGATFSVTGAGTPTPAGAGSEVSVVVRGRAAPGLAWLGARATPTGTAVAAREEVGLDGPPR
jgi:hypothetical protein